MTYSMPVVFVRHGPTPWNRQHRLQGRRDVELSEDARSTLVSRRLPPRYAAFQWYSSPLVRAVETARLLGAMSPRAAQALIEMDWGAWEGRTLASLRRRLGERMSLNESRGLDFRPPGGESPREVRDRLHAWLDEAATATRPVVAVTHKGVIRAALSLATGWDLRSRPPYRLHWSRVHEFTYDAGRRCLRVARLNQELVRL